MRVGIIFGGPSREREISFAGGRTVYDNLDKRLFDPVPLFMTATRRLVLLEWSYLYKGTIRDFWPPVSAYPPDAGPYQLSEESLGALSDDEQEHLARSVGRPVAYDELPSLIDVAFVALHGVGGEDGAIQGALETLGLPYTGSGLAGSAIGMDKVLQKRLMAGGGFFVPPAVNLERAAWVGLDPGTPSGKTAIEDLLRRCIDAVGTPIVIRGANQGSSIGVTILREPDAVEFAAAIDRALFRHRIDLSYYRALDAASRRTFVSNVADLRHGIGFPMRVGARRLLAPIELQDLLDDTSADEVLLEGEHGESRVVVEGFLAGTEVSTIVIRTDDGGCLALLPTEIVKGGEVFDYRSKYLPGLSRKKTPAELPTAALDAVRAEAERLFAYFEFDTYARIDGFVSPEGRVALNDPNTTSGMLPSSFFFHQAAEIGLSPREFLTYILRTSLRERARRTTVPYGYRAAADAIDARLRELREGDDARTRIAVLLGGYSSERHISVESGRNVFEKLASSGRYVPRAVFVAGDSRGHRLYELPVSLLLKDNADDIRQAIEQPRAVHEVTARVRAAAAPITRLFSEREAAYAVRELDYPTLAADFDEVFIALHGRPGEDGEVQRALEAVGLPYNGSGYAASQVTIDKYETLARLRAAGFPTTDQVLVTAAEFAADPHATVRALGERLGYPLIVKPVDDGCSSAVQKIADPRGLHDFLTLLLGMAPEQQQAALRLGLGIALKEEIPTKSVALVERLIAREGADLFLEITGGLLTRFGESPTEHADDGSAGVTGFGESPTPRRPADAPQDEGRAAEPTRVYEVFEPSEALSTGQVLTLEEKFLAGEGQNITPARFAFGAVDYEHVAARVRETLGRAAEVLGVEGYARIDAFVRAWSDGRVETIIIEVNSLPGMTPATCIYHQAALEGYTPFGFIDRIMAYGRERAARLRAVDVGAGALTRGVGVPAVTD